MSRGKFGVVRCEFSVVRKGKAKALNAKSAKVKGKFRGGVRKAKAKENAEAQRTQR